MVRFHHLKCWDFDADDVGMAHEDGRAIARGHLATLLKRVMADGKVDDAEREDLQRVFGQAILTVNDVREVFGQYLGGLRDEVLADGHVTAEERQRCVSAVEQLKIPLRLLPPALLAIVRGRPVAPAARG